ncbi:type VI secretion system lipoprotein TssJ [Archangium sp.]|uniref:type VI secretion system lipoprotein TssJ n=1 Tax=Archangium sp. TaxID=1872627 RepID=UPI0039C87C56
MALFLACTACTAVKLEPCDTPPPFHVRIETSERVNPDPRGRSMTTVVQILQLKDSTRLENATFQKLWNGPEKFLEDDLLHVTELTLAPDQHVERWIPRDPKTRFVVAMGHFRQPLGSAWRTVVKLQPVPKPLCREEPEGGEHGPRPMDAQFLIKLQGYQVDLLRDEPQVEASTPLQPQRGPRPPHDGSKA